MIGATEVWNFRVRLHGVPRAVVDTRLRFGLNRRAAQGAGGPDLVAVGSHGHSRIGGILLGSVATALIHEAPGVNPPG